MRKSNPGSNRSVSFTFDDVPASGIINGSKLLNDHQFKGTFYLSLSFRGGEVGNNDLFTKDDVFKLYKDGHELGCHTFSHLLFLKEKKQTVIKEDIIKNQSAIRSLGLDVNFESFAYPGGGQTVKGKSVVSKIFNTSRGLDYGINLKNVDLNNLKSVRLYQNQFPIDRIKVILNEFAKSGGWLVFYTHDVQDSYSKYGCSPSYLDSVIKHCEYLNIDVCSVKEAFVKITQNK